MSVQEEATFGGSATGSLMQLSGLREFESELAPVLRESRVSAWRQESAQARAGSCYTGRLDMEVVATSATALLVRNFLAFLSETTVSGRYRRAYVTPASGAAAVGSLRFLLEYDGGPWVTFSGAVVTALRLSVHAPGLARLSADWWAASKQTVGSDPAWTPVYEYQSPLPSHLATVTLDGAPVDNVLDLSVGLSAPRRGSNLLAAGAYSAATRDGPLALSGTLTEYVEDSSLMDLVDSGGSFDLGISLADCSGVTRLELSLDDCAAQSGQPAPVGVGDVTEVVAWKLLIPEATAAAAAPQLAITTDA